MLLAHPIRHVVIAGDLFEAGVNADLAAELVSWLIAAGVEAAVVPGNHDRGLANFLTACPSIPKVAWWGAGAWFTATAVCRTARWFTVTNTRVPLVEPRRRSLLSDRGRKNCPAGLLGGRGRRQRHSHSEMA